MGRSDINPQVTTIILGSLLAIAAAGCKNRSDDRFFSSGSVEPRGTVNQSSSQDAQEQINDDGFDPNAVGDWMKIPKGSTVIIIPANSGSNVSSGNNNYNDGYRDGFQDGVNSQSTNESSNGQNDNGSDVITNDSTTDSTNDQTNDGANNPNDSTTTGTSTGTNNDGGSNESSQGGGQATTSPPEPDNSTLSNPPTSGTQACWCAGGALGQQSVGGIAVYMLPSLEAAQACARKISKPSQFSNDGEACSRFASYGQCSCNGLSAPWEISPRAPMGRALSPACLCLHGRRGLSPKRFPTWLKPVRWNKPWQ